MAPDALPGFSGKQIFSKLSEATWIKVGCELQMLYIKLCN
jgi:hypothetical protein